MDACEIENLRTTESLFPFGLHGQYISCCAGRAGTSGTRSGFPDADVSPVQIEIMRGAAQQSMLEPILR